MLVSSVHHWISIFVEGLNRTALGHRVLHTHALRRAICGNSVQISWSITRYHELKYTD